MSEVTLDVLIERARCLIPVLKERALDTERRRERLPETMADLHRLGLLKYYQPKMFGGYEMDWGAHAHIATELAKGCTYTAWIQCVVGSHTWTAARFGMAAQKELFADPDVLIATAFAGGRNVEVKVVEGGYRLTGEWSFASGLSPFGMGDCRQPDQIRHPGRIRNDPICFTGMLMTGLSLLVMALYLLFLVFT